MIAEINKAWNWKGVKTTEVVRTNEFGNVIFKTDKNVYWRICPEEVSCEKIAESESEFNKIASSSEFKEDWEMANLVNSAKFKLGKLKESEKYCLKVPAVIGGAYEESNLGKIDFLELIAFSGALDFQLKNLKDGQKIKLTIKGMHNNA